jgi:hypothetical protein
VLEDLVGRGTTTANAKITALMSTTINTCVDFGLDRPNAISLQDIVNGIYVSDITQRELV